MALYNKISKGPSIIQWPPFFNPRASDLILKLMETDPSKRYGNMRNGAGDVFAHPWFKEVVWQNLLTKYISPPYIPRTISDGDASAYVVSALVYPPPFSSADLTRCSGSNVIQRTKLQPSTDGLDWTSSVIFSGSGITLREGSHVKIPTFDLLDLSTLLSASSPQSCPPSSSQSQNVHPCAVFAKMFLCICTLYLSPRPPPLSFSPSFPIGLWHADSPSPSRCIYIPPPPVIPRGLVPHLLFFLFFLVVLRMQSQSFV